MSGLPVDYWESVDDKTLATALDVATEMATGKRRESSTDAEGRVMSG